MSDRPIRAILDTSAIIAFTPSQHRRPPCSRGAHVDPVSWRALAVVYDTVGRLDAASALPAAVDHGCNVLTWHPGLYAGLAGGGPIIPL